MQFKFVPHLLAGAIAVGAMVSTGCVGHVGVGVEPAPTVVEPDLAFVGPGVWVVQDYHEPVFYSGGSYYLYRGGLWYRSGTHYSGWSRVYNVPVGIRRVRQPRRYVRYRARPGVRTWRPGPRVRDHRTGRTYRPRPPAVRDRRVARPAPRPQPHYGSRVAPRPPRHHNARRVSPPRHHNARRVSPPRHHNARRVSPPRHHTVRRAPTAPARHTRVRTPVRQKDNRVYKPAKRSKRDHRR